MVIKMETFRKIDLHVHSQTAGGPQRLRGGTWPTPEEVRTVYDEIGIERGVEMPREAPERSHDPITTRFARQIAEEYPDVFAGWFCFLDPRMGTNSPKDDLTYYLDFYRDQGARGVGELQANIYIDDPRMMNLLAACEKREMPVTVHFGKLGEGCGVADDPGLPRTERVLKAFPKLLLLGHAQVFWSEISGDVTEETRNGFPSGPVVGEGRTVALMRRYPNLCADLSARSAYNALSRSPGFGARFLTEFRDRLFYATDISSPESITIAGKMAAFLDGLLADGSISRETYETVCRKNAERLLKGDFRAV